MAQAAIDRGAAIVNDISALRYDPELASVVARTRVALILMHNRGRSREMYRAADYRNVVEEVAAELDERISAAGAAGIPRERRDRRSGHRLCQACRAQPDDDRRA